MEAVFDVNEQRRRLGKRQWFRISLLLILVKSFTSTNKCFLKISPRTLARIALPHFISMKTDRLISGWNGISEFMKEEDCVA